MNTEQAARPTDIYHRIITAQEAGLPPQVKQLSRGVNFFLSALVLGGTFLRTPSEVQAQSPPTTNMAEPAQSDNPPWVLAAGQLGKYIEQLIGCSSSPVGCHDTLGSNQPAIVMTKSPTELNQLLNQIYEPVRRPDGRPSAVIKVHDANAVEGGLRIEDEFSYSYLLQNPETGKIADSPIPNEIIINGVKAIAVYNSDEDRIQYADEQGNILAEYDVARSLEEESFANGWHRFKLPNDNLRYNPKPTFISYEVSQQGGSTTTTTENLPQPTIKITPQDDASKTLSFYITMSDRRIQIRTPKEFLSPFTQALVNWAIVADEKEPSTMVLYAGEKVVGEIDIKTGKMTFLYQAQVKDGVSTLNIREQPSTSAKKIGRLEGREGVEIIGRYDGWLLLRNGGWVASKYIQGLEIDMNKLPLIDPDGSQVAILKPPPLKIEYYLNQGDYKEIITTSDGIYIPIGGRKGFTPKNAKTIEEALDYFKKLYPSEFLRWLNQLNFRFVLNNDKGPLGSVDLLTNTADLSTVGSLLLNQQKLEPFGNWEIAVIVSLFPHEIGGHLALIKSYPQALGAQECLRAGDTYINIERYASDEFRKIMEILSTSGRIYTLPDEMREGIEYMMEQDMLEFNYENLERACNN